LVEHLPSNHEAKFIPQYWGEKKKRKQSPFFWVVLDFELRQADALPLKPQLPALFALVIFQVGSHFGLDQLGP
jgi:hypothetical protein